MKQAIKTYGDNMQMLVAIEELSELQKAILKFIRRENEDVDVKGMEKYRKDVIEEMADVEIMLKQLQIIFCSKGATQSVAAFKIDRLSKRLGN